MDKITLAVDASTNGTGWAFRLNGTVHHGVIKAPKEYDKDVMSRSRYMAHTLAELVDCYDVVNLMIERPIKKLSIDTTIKLSLVDGMIIGAVRHGYTITPLPNEWRSWYGLTVDKNNRSKWKDMAIAEAQAQGYDLTYRLVNKGKANERKDYSDDEAEAILILLAAEKKGL